MIQEFKTQIELAAPIESVFDFFSDARNLEMITPPWLQFRILSQSTEPIRQGTLLRYALRIKKIPLRWDTLIESWNPPHHFADRQIKGPYRLWLHHHRFTPAGSGTLMEDTVQYEVPLGKLGHWLAGSLVKRDVERIFAYRRGIILNYFC